MNLFKRLTQANTNASLEKISVLNRPLKLGDFVVHTVSGFRGVITAVEQVGGRDVLTIEGTRTLRGISRQEFRLANAERGAL